MSDDRSTPEESELLAAELALGLLDDADRLAALARLQTDPALAEVYARWQALTADLASDVGDEPPAHLWDAIAARLPSNDDQPRRVRHWQLATAASLAACLTLGVVALRRPPPPQLAVVRPIHHVTFVAVLTGDAGALAVTYDATARRLITAPGAVRLAGGSAELWAIRAGRKPVSLGIIPVGMTHAATPPPAGSAALGSDVTLAVSVEPRGGSPTGQPTGPVILSGKITAS